MDTAAHIKHSNLYCCGLRLGSHSPTHSGAERGQGEPGKDGETSTTAGAPGNIDPGTETSARHKYGNGSDELGQGRLDDAAPRRPTSDQGPRDLGGFGLGQDEPTLFFLPRPLTTAAMTASQEQLFIRSNRAMIQPLPSPLFPSLPFPSLRACGWVRGFIGRRFNMTNQHRSD